MNNYIVKYAAGTWWIVKCAQTTEEYKPPVPINESGADIFKGLINGKSVNDIAKQLSLEYGISEEEALSDVNDFADELAGIGITDYED